MSERGHNDGRCCENGFFGQTHNCRKSNSTFAREQQRIQQNRANDVTFDSFVEPVSAPKELKDAAKEILKATKISSSKPAAPDVHSCYEGHDCGPKPASAASTPDAVSRINELDHELKQSRYLHDLEFEENKQLREQVARLEALQRDSLDDWKRIQDAERKCELAEAKTNLKTINDVCNEKIGKLQTENAELRAGYETKCKLMLERDAARAEQQALVEACELFVKANPGTLAIAQYDNMCKVLKSLEKK